jgi:hypothetical protein
MGYYDKVDYYVAVIISDEDEDDTVEDNFADAEMVYDHWCKTHPEARVYIQQMDTGRITDERLAATL